jgi:glycosyltransferase involved in cell wall biosynthesis
MVLLLQRNGYEISVVTPKIYKESRYYEMQGGIKIYRFPFLSGNRLLIEYEKIPYVRMVLYYITGLLFVTFVIVKQRCGLIHAHWAIPTGLIAVIARFLVRKPFIVTIHGSDFRLAMEKSSFIKKLFLFVCKKAGHIICVSEILRREIENLGIEGKKISTLPMGVGEGFLAPGKYLKNRRENHPITVLSNRKFLPIYNVSLLIRAIPIVLKEEPNVKFIFAGDGPERKNVERQAETLAIGSSIEFLGWVRHEEMAKLLSRSEIYISTSLDDGTSVSLLEAMAAGAFPIVTDIPSNREWISDGENGFLVPIDEERVLAIRIIEAIRNRPLLERARERNLRLVSEKALWSATIEKTERIYEKILSLGN